MPRKGENIYKRRDGRYEARYIIGRKDNGKARYKSVYGRTCGEARAKKMEGMRIFEESKAGKSSMSQTVSVIAGEWIRDESYKWKESTLCRYKEKLKLYIIPKYGRRNISDITTDEVEAYLANLQTESGRRQKPVGASSAGLVLTVFKNLIQYARKKEIKIKFVAECVKVKRTKEPVRALSEKEENMLVDYLKKNSNETDIAILTCLFTGMRVGEICALKCDDIDLDECLLHVNKTMQRLSSGEEANKTAVRINSPKSDCSKRTIPISPKLADMIRPFHKPGAYLLTGDSERFVEPRTMENRFARIMDKCGLERVNFHVTRHTFATRCIERGMDSKTLSELLGHASVATTLDRYVHLTMSHKAESIKLIEDIL